MKRMVMFVVVSAILVVPLSASEVSFAPLRNIVKQASWIIKAKITAVDHQATHESRRVKYIVAPTAVLVGIPEVPGSVSLSYEEVSPLIKDERGNTIGWVSPIYSGSGKEFAAKTEEEWIFLLVANRLSESTPTQVLRAEPASMEDEIRLIIGNSAAATDGSAQTK